MWAREKESAKQIFDNYNSFIIQAREIYREVAWDDIWAILLNHTQMYGVLALHQLEFVTHKSGMLAMSALSLREPVLVDIC